MTKIQTAEKRCRAAWKAAPTAKLAWCCHHAVLIEALTDPAEARIDYIRYYKSKAEQEARFDNFRPVISPLPPAFSQAGSALSQARSAFSQAESALSQVRSAYDQARSAYDQARSAYDQARPAYDQARSAYGQARSAYDQARSAYDQAQPACMPELLKAYVIDVPEHTWNGEDIFE